MPVNIKYCAVKALYKNEMCFTIKTKQTGSDLTQENIHSLLTNIQVKIIYAGKKN